MVGPGAAQFSGPSTNTGNTVAASRWVPGVPDLLERSEGHGCALFPDSTVQCWGKNNAGQFGDGTTDASLVPVQVVGSGGVGFLSDVAAADGGRNFTCAAQNSGAARDQLGDNSGTDSLTPVQVVGSGSSMMSTAPQL